MLNPEAVGGSASGESVLALHGQYVEIIVLPLAVEQLIQVVVFARHRAGDAFENNLADHAHALLFTGGDEQFDLGPGAVVPLPVVALSCQKDDTQARPFCRATIK